MRCLRLLFVCGLIGTAIAQAQPSATAQSPDRVAASFYRWYLHEIDTGNPATVQSQAPMKEYVSSELLDSLRSKKGADADYFLKAQDTLEDWADNVTASTPKVTGDTARTTITLGATSESKHELAVTLLNDHGKWKIQRVSTAHK